MILNFWNWPLFCRQIKRSEPEASEPLPEKQWPIPKIESRTFNPINFHIKTIMKWNFQKLTLSIALTLFSTASFASDFNIPFVNASELGDLYAGWAASANDASTAFTNPAGLTRIKNQQWVFAALGIFGTAGFDGTATPPFPPFPPQSAEANTKIHGFLPSFYYATPIMKNLFFGFSVTTPFALGTNYSKTSIVRYSATQSSILANDFGPSVGFKLTDKLSAGLGLDIDRLELTLNYLIGMPPFFPNFESQNHVVGWGYGMHAGLLYEFTPCTRVGINYNSQIAFHAAGDSNLYSPLLPNNRFSTNQQKLNMTLPALAQLSVYHDFDSQWAGMASVFYSDWSVFKSVTLQNVMLPTGQTFSNTVPFNYRNTLDYSAGLSYKLNRKWTFRTGVEYLGEPSNSGDRIVADPVGAGIVLGVGAHYQQNCALGYDIGLAHAFFHDVGVNHVTTFDTEFGYCRTQTNVVGIQVTWNQPNVNRV